MTMTTEATSIYHAIGGRAALVAAVDDFTVLGEALGGPERYRGPDLARAHGGRVLGRYWWPRAG